MRLLEQEKTAMRKSRLLRTLVVAMLLIIISAGCNSQKEANGDAATPGKEKAAASSTLDQNGTAVKTEAGQPQAEKSLAASSETALEVNGVKFTNGQVDGEVARNIEGLSRNLTPDRLEKMMPEVRKEVVEDFINRTILNQEAKKLKLEASEKEIDDAIGKVTAGLPQGATIEDLLSKMHMTEKDFRDRVALSVKMNKLMLSLPQGNVKPGEKEITAYYEANKDKFKAPESVHARHILVGTDSRDDEKALSVKKAKAEMLRSKLLAGADFADLAKNSDCPSKNNGGDLGEFSRGQMVKSFEDAAFSQKVNEIGPVVKTDFGFHVIQVLAHTEAKAIALDKKVSEEIGAFLQRQKQQESFANMLKKLRAKATIIITGA